LWAECAEELFGPIVQEFRCFTERPDLRNGNSYREAPSSEGVFLSSVETWYNRVMTKPFGGKKIPEPTGIYFTCRLCGVEKDTCQFPTDKGYKSGFNSRCRECSRKLMSETQRNGKQVTNDKKRKMIRDAKGKPCADCKKVFPYFVMDLDHLPGFDKSFQLGKYMERTLAEVESELAKCEAVCANCHRYRTARRAGWDGGDINEHASNIPRLD
jgi:hypothetical protein